MKKLFVSVLVIAVALIIVACGSTDKKEENNLQESAMSIEYKDAPDWVTTNGKSDFPQDICEVGTFAGSGNPRMMRNAALNDAKVRLAGKFNTKIKALVKDYMASTTSTAGGNEFGTAVNDEQHHQEASISKININMSGADERKNWPSKYGKGYYVLVCVDMAKFKSALNNMENLSEQVRQAVVERAEKAWDELKAE